MSKKMVKLAVLVILLISLISITYADSVPLDNSQNPQNDAVSAGSTPPASSQTPTEQPLPNWLVFVYCFIGVVVSFVLPSVIKYVKELGVKQDRLYYLNILKPYAALAVASFCIAVIVIAYSLSQGATFTHWFMPFLGGYTFDATLQKLKEGFK